MKNRARRSAEAVAGAAEPQRDDHETWTPTGWNTARCSAGANAQIAPHHGGDAGQPRGAADEAIDDADRSVGHRTGPAGDSRVRRNQL